MRAASQVGMARSSAAMSPAVSAPNASNATAAPAASIPAPLPARLPRSVISALASSISWRTSVLVSLARSLTSSLIEWSRSAGCSSCPSGPIVASGRDRQLWLRPLAIGVALVVRVALVALVALAARGLQEARGGEPDDDADPDHRHRLPAAEVLDVAQEAVGVGLGQVAAHAICVISDPVGRPGLRVLALLAQVLAGAAQRLRRGADLLAGLRRALIDLLARPRLSLLGALLHLLLRGLGIHRFSFVRRFSRTRSGRGQVVCWRLGAER